MSPRWKNSCSNLFSFMGTRFSPWRIALFVLVFLTASQFLSFSSLSPTEQAEEASRESLSSWPNNHVAFDTGQVSHNVATGRVLVTGGGGNVGKHLVRRLLTASTPVTILDAIYYPDELASSLSPSARSLLKVVKGDIRNTTLLSDVFTPDVVGVVHLAAVSRVLRCLQNEADCRDINERGTKLVLEALSDLNAKDNGRRWFILASSGDVYDMEKSVNLHGTTKLAAEKVLETHLEAVKKKLGKESDKWWKWGRGGALHAVVLRLSNVYGSVYDHVERLVPSVTTQALSHQVIQISGGHQHLDLLHIDDCVDGFLLTIKHLTSSLSKPSHTYLEVFDLASGSSVSISTIVSILATLTQTKSPIRYIQVDNRFPDLHRGSIEKSERILGYKPSISVTDGLHKLVRTYLKQTEHFLAAKTSSTCGRASPSLETDSDEHMDKLDKCKVHVDVNIHGEFVALVPPAEGKRDGWNTSTDMPPPDLETVISNSHPGSGRHGPKRLIRILARDKGPVYLGAKKMSEPQPGPVVFENIKDEDIANLGDAEVFVDWELEVNTEQGTVRLVVPGTNLVLMGPTFVGSNFSLVEMEGSGGGPSGKQRKVWPMRISPICCPAPAPWPFFRDDPVDFTIEYQKNSLERPFLASPAKALCNRLEHARIKVMQDIARLSTRLRESSSLDRPPNLGHTLSPYSTDWVDSDLPACSNACDHPTICVDTGDCQCVLSSCPSVQRYPFASFANLPVISYPPPPPRTPSIEPSSSSPLVEVVERSSWQNVLRPQALHFIGLNVSFPRISVAPLSEDDREWVKNWKDGKGKQYDIGALREQHCLSADAQMERAVQRMGYQLSGEDEEEGAEMTFVPHYQGRWGGDGRIDKTYDYTAKTLKGFDAAKVIIPFTFDWGLCLTFEWNVWDFRQKHVPEVSPIVRSTTAWSVMADLNSPCYRPHQDVVIPPRTCKSAKLYEAFEDIAYVRPARDRRVLVTFAGSSWGTGSLNRQRLECPREGWSVDETRRRLYPEGPWLKVLFDKTMYHDYISILNDTIFCMQPAGIVGWSPRLVDAIYAGCIPVVIGHSSHYPFFDIFDWSKISVKVETPDLSNLENVLFERYTLADIERLQANIMLVRDAFVYPLDDVDAEHAQKRMLDDRGPLFFALHSTRMRMMTQWPTEVLIDHP